MMEVYVFPRSTQDKYIKTIMCVGGEENIELGSMITHHTEYARLRFRCCREVNCV